MKSVEAPQKLQGPGGQENPFYSEHRQPLILTSLAFRGGVVLHEIDYGVLTDASGRRRPGSYRRAGDQEAFSKEFSDLGPKVPGFAADPMEVKQQCRRGHRYSVGFDEVATSTTRARVVSGARDAHPRVRRATNDRRDPKELGNGVEPAPVTAVAEFGDAQHGG